MSATAETAPPLIAAPTRPARRPPRRQLRRWLVAGAAYLVAVIFLLPYLEMLVMAGRPNNELGQATILPSHWTFSNFTTLWSASAGDLGGSIVTSLEIAAGATFLVLLVALPAAYYTARHRFRGRLAFLLLVLATQMFQPAAMLVGLQREFSNFSWASPTVSLVIINAGFNMAFAVWILNAFFTSIPVELEEAAMVDGLGKVGALLRITLPLAAPGLAMSLAVAWARAIGAFGAVVIIAYHPFGIPMQIFTTLQETGLPTALPYALVLLVVALPLPLAAYVWSARAERRRRG